MQFHQRGHRAGEYRRTDFLCLHLSADKYQFPDVTRNMSKKESPKKVTRFHGIVGHAERLGVSRIHLWLVLSGRRQSRSLLKRYRKIKEAAR